MPASLRFVTQSGRAPDVVVARAIDSMVATEGDALAVANEQRTRTLQRTARGVDRDGKPFKPYSTQGPIYVDVGGKGGSSRSVAQKVASVQRLLKKVGRKADKPQGLPRASTTRRKAALGTSSGISAAARVGSTSKGRAKPRKSTPAFGITPGGLLKVPSYAAFKLQVLGRSVVDLFGHRAPHMLQALVVKLGGRVFRNTGRVAVTERRAEARQVAIGFFGEEAARAIGNNRTRRFFGLGLGDPRAIVTSLQLRVRARLRLVVSR